MTAVTHDIVAKLWNLCNVLKDDGVTDHQYDPSLLSFDMLGPQSLIPRSRMSGRKSALSTPLLVEGNGSGKSNFVDAFHFVRDVLTPSAVMIKAMTTWTQSERLSRESPN